MWQQLKEEIAEGNIRSLSRAISLVENEHNGYLDFLASLNFSTIPIIGITGPPGAGKSSITDALIELLINDGKKVAVLCIDPSSAFSYGAILGDRIRMNRWHENPNVYIRSLATRGSLGGLSAKTIEIADLIKHFPTDFLFIETVGVGQNEIEIASLADICLLTLVPEAGDEVQAMKAGIMEIADIFVVNKADRPGASTFIKNLQLIVNSSSHNVNEEIPIVKTVAVKKEGIEILLDNIYKTLALNKERDKKHNLIVEKTIRIIQQQIIKRINKEDLMIELEKTERANIYLLVKKIIEKYKL